MKSGSLNLLEPSGPVKACNGIALPLLLSRRQRERERSALLNDVVNEVR
jgi:hypothetical protein